MNDNDPKNHEQQPVRPPIRTIHIPDENFTAVFIDQGLNQLRGSRYCDLLEAKESWFVSLGMYGLYGVSVLGLLAAVVLPLRYDWLPGGYTLLGGLAWFLATIVLHYIAWKFLPYIHHIIRATPTRVSSPILDVFALVTALGGIGCLVWGIVLWVKTSSFSTFLFAVCLAVLSEYAALLSLRPSHLNIHTDGSRSAGQEFLGFLSYSVKLNLRLIPVTFGLGLFLGLAFMINLLFSRYDYVGALLTDFGLTLAAVLYASLLPLSGYLIFLFWHFLIDLGSAILGPQKQAEDTP